jgi:hypothetical protein
MKKIPLVLFLLLLTAIGFSQSETDNREVERAYENFKKTFSSEFSQSAERTVTPVAFLPPAKLPQWFFDFKHHSPAQNIFPGISDAGLDSVSAYQQALGRALAMAAFAQKTNVQNIHDNYYQDRNGISVRGVFNSFTTYTAAASINFQVVKNHATENGEIILLIETGQNEKEAVNVACNMELFQSEGQKDMMTRMSVEIEIESPGSENLNLGWLINENKRSFEVESSINGKKLRPLNARFLYHPSGNDLAMQNFAYHFDLKYGLAATFFNALAVNLEQFEVFDSQIKTVSEQYSGRFQNLTRIIFTDAFSFDVANIQIQKNQLYLTLKRIDQPK